jgi:hypothetical protein
MSTRRIDIFLGTRGEIEARTRRHGMHTSLAVSYHRRKVMIDAGADRRGRLSDARPRAVVVTHVVTHGLGPRRHEAGAPLT